eukprot:gene52982-64724_t
MTGGISHQLWRLSEAGEPVVMLGRQHAVGEEAAFERLLQLGILLHRGREASWDVCADCDCGADEREVLWDGDIATAKCAADRRRDERLDADDVRSFSVVMPAFMDGVAAAMGLGRWGGRAPGASFFKPETLVSGFAGGPLVSRLRARDAEGVVYQVSYDARSAAAPQLERAEAGQLARCAQHTPGMHADVAGQAFKFACQLKQRVNVFFLGLTL